MPEDNDANNNVCVVCNSSNVDIINTTNMKIGKFNIQNIKLYFEIYGNKWTFYKEEKINKKIKRC